jgi:hypothetical protein
MFEHGEAETEIECRPVGVEPHRRLPSQEWLEFEAGVISSLFAQSALMRRWRSRHENATKRRPM